MHRDRSEVEEERLRAILLAFEPSHGARREVAHRLRVVAFGGVEAELAGCGRKFLRAQTEDAVIFHKHARDVVVILRDGELVVESEFERAGLEFLGVVHPRIVAVTEMPCADQSRGVAVALQERRDGRAGRLDKEGSKVLATSPELSRERQQ